jgi:arabinose-5-phosphate isomerase
MRNINKGSIAKKTIKKEAQALNQLTKKIDHNFEKACDILLACTGKIITIGLGKSGHVAKKASATFSSTGSPSIFLHAAEALHGDMGLVEKSDVVIFYSNSGETKELLLLLPLFKILKVPLITITGNKKSTLSKKSNVTIDSGVKSEACPLDLAPTSSVISAIAMSDALAITLLECRGFTSKDFAKSHPQGSLGKRLLRKSEDIMFTKNLPYVYKDLPLMKAIDIVTKYNYGIVIILNSSKQLRGIFTDGDLRRVLKKYNNISSLSLYKVMTKKPLMVSIDIMAVEALNIMEKNEITSLVVINHDKTVAGLLTLNELLKNGIE